MNAADILHYGHLDVLKSFEGLSASEWDRLGVTSRWSPKQLLAHLCSYERVLGDILESLMGRGPTPDLDAFRNAHGSFNDTQVAARDGLTANAILEEYGRAHERVIALAREAGPERLAAPGAIPWYGPDYAVDDFIVYANYAHKREHCAQLKQFRQRVAA
jgi:hypothetical protein